MMVAQVHRDPDPQAFMLACENGDVALALSRRRVIVLTNWYPDETLSSIGSSPYMRLNGAFVREQAAAVSRLEDVVVVHLQAERRPTKGLFQIIEERDSGLRVFRVRRRDCKWRHLGAAARMFGLAAVFFRLRRERWKTDLIHAHVYGAGLAGIVIGRILGVPVVITEHLSAFTTNSLSTGDSRRARYAFGNADLVCPVSHDLKSHLENAGVKAAFEVVPNVVDISEFHPPPFLKIHYPVRLVAVGMLNAGKSYGDLLLALKELTESTASCFHLDIVGDGPLRSDLEQLAENLGLGTKVDFWGLRSKSEVAELMRHSDLFVQSSLYENLPCVIIEALASGLPVVATSVGGIPEMIDASNGVLAEPGSPMSLAGAIQKALRTYPNFDRLNIANTAAQRYSAEELSAKWSEIYERLLS